MTMGNKIVKVYVLKGLNGTSLVIENYRVSNEKIYGMLTPIYTFEVATDDILQAIGQKHNQSKDCVSRQMVKEGMIKYGFRAPDMTVTEFVEDELPPVTPTQRWIPVSEKLPDTNETVLCWYEYYHWSLEKVLPEYGLGYYFKEVGAWGGEVAILRLILLRNTNLMC